MLTHAFMLTQEACDLERAAHAWFAFAARVAERGLDLLGHIFDITKKWRAKII